MYAGKRTEKYSKGDKEKHLTDTALKFIYKF